MWNHYVVHYYFLIFLRFISCCQCNLNYTDSGVDKRELELEEFSTTEFIDNTGTSTDPEGILTTTNLLQSSFFEINDTTTESNEKTKGLFEIETNKTHIILEEHDTSDIFQLNENSSEIVEAIVDRPENNFGSNYLGSANPNETTTESETESKTGNQPHSDLWKKCRYYMNGDSFNLEKMADVWQVVYYRLPNKLKCFKLHIKAVKLKDQRRYLRVFGSFNNTVRWNHCFLEITSSEKENSGRRHFLQGTQSDKGVMENVIIDEEYDKSATYLALHRESGDQWLVIDNLLVMRDCENGDFVVFARFPLHPRKTEIMDALKMFGENIPNGTIACDIEKSWLKLDEDVHLHDDNH